MTKAKGIEIVNFITDLQNAGCKLEADLIQRLSDQFGDQDWKSIIGMSNTGAFRAIISCQLNEIPESNTSITEHPILFAAYKKAWVARTSEAHFLDKNQHFLFA